VTVKSKNAVDTVTLTTTHVTGSTKLALGAGAQDAPLPLLMHALDAGLPLADAVELAQVVIGTRHARRAGAHAGRLQRRRR
jgi:hypothetical protein